MALDRPAGEVPVGVTEWTLGCAGAAAISRARQLGFNAIQLDAVPEGGSENRLAQGAGLQSCLQALKENDMCLTAVTASALNEAGLKSALGTLSAQRCLTSIEESIEVAKALGAQLVYFPAFDAAELRTPDDLKRAAEVLQEVGAIAVNQDVAVAVETTLGGAETTRLLDLSGHSDVQALLDIYNLMSRNIDVLDFVKRVSSRICRQVHLKEGAGGYVGQDPLTAELAGVLTMARWVWSQGLCLFPVLENCYDLDPGRAAADIAAVRATLRADIGTAEVG